VRHDWAPLADYVLNGITALFLVGFLVCAVVDYFHPVDDTHTTQGWIEVPSPEPGYRCWTHGTTPRPQPILCFAEPLTKPR
jgi:hypothetical protein